MSLISRIDKELTEVQAQIDRIKERSNSEIGALTRRRAALETAKRAITPELEAAVTALERVGIVPLP